MSKESATNEKFNIKVVNECYLILAKNRNNRFKYNEIK